MKRIPSRSAVVVGLALIPVLSGCGGPKDGDGGCVRPGVSVSPHTVAAGSSVQVVGKGFFADCRDTDVIGVSGTSTGAKQIRILLVHEGKRTPLGYGRPDKKTGEFSSSITIPSSSPMGEAQIVAGEPTSYGDDIVITK